MPYHTLSLTYGFLLLVHAGYTQDFSIPSIWPNKSIHASTSQRFKLAQAALDRVYLERYNEDLGEFKSVDYPQSPKVLMSFAFKDYVAGTKDNQFVVNALTTADELHPIFNGNKMWGLACIYAYRAYNDLSMLRLAEAAWSQGNQYVISASQAANGSHPLKTSHFFGACNGVSVEGGVLYDTNTQPDDIRITTSSVGSLVILSAHLAEITSEEKYKDAAILSANFLEAQMVDGSGLVIDVLGLATTNDACSKPNPLLTADSGALIEGFMVLADVTGDSSWRIRALRTLAAATHTRTWAYQDGTVSEGAEGFQDLNSHKNTYMRSLYEAWARSPSDGSLRTFIKTYVTVQYNGMLTYSTIPGSNVYGFDWHSRPTQNDLTTDSLLSSLNLLSVAAAVGDDLPQSSSATIPASSTNTSIEDSSTETEPKNKTNVVAIAAGVTAPIMVLALVVSIFCFRRHRARRVQSSAPTPFGPAEYGPVQLVNTHDLQMRQSLTRPLRSLPSRPSKPRVAMASSAQALATCRAENTNVVRPEPELPTLELMRILHARLEAGEPTPTEVSSPPAYSERGRRG